MESKLKSKQQGFTIIEVMIVLAIAGLIMLIVFLAVPALQRNSRNTQRQNDASRLVAAINECSNNHNGKLSSCLPGASGGDLDDYIDISQNQQLYEDPATQKGNATFNKAAVITGAQCNSEGNDTVSQGGSRAFVVFYKAETGSGDGANRCVG